MNNDLQTTSGNLKSFPIFLAFLCMGFGDVVGTLVGFAKESFELSNTMAQLIPMMGFIMFGILSVPTGILQDKKGKKFVLILGLIIALIGLIIPLFGLTAYGLLLVSILLLGAGGAIIQVAGNPIMRDVSPPGKYSRNLSLGQFIKAIGSLSGPVLPVVAVVWIGLDKENAWLILFPVYSAVILITIVAIIFLKTKSQNVQKIERASLKSSFALMKNKYVLIMVLGVFLYVGAEVSMNSGIATYLNDKFGLDISSTATLGIGFFFTALMLGRLLGAIILNWMNAKKFFLITSIISVISILGLFAGNLTLSIISIFIIGLGFANIFPLMFSVLIDTMPERSNELSGLMVMAIIGGAIMPFIMGVIADQTTVLTGFLVPLFSLVFIIWTAIISLKKCSTL